MRKVIGLVLAATLLAGCAHHHRKTTAQPVIKPDLQLTGSVAMVNADARFVVVTFPPGSVPSTDARLDVFRNGLKVGELKVTGPQRENDTVADIVSGQIQPRDEVKGQ